MKARSKSGTVGRCLAFTALLLVNACSGVDGEGFDPEGGDGAGTAEGALSDSSTMDGTAKLALVPAAKASLSSANDPLNPISPLQVEYCGFIFRKTSTGTFHASAARTSNESLRCVLRNVPIPAGSKLVGYYHTHTPQSVPGISPNDIREANGTNPKLVYYVVSTKTKCAEKYDPSLGGRPSTIGCLTF